LSKLAHRLLKKKWTKQDIQDLVGGYKEAYTAYALDDRIRLGGASGGVTTAILTCALQNGYIDGALVCRTVVSDQNKVRTKFFIAHNKSQLLFSQDSKYVQTNFVPEAMRLIDSFEGRLAVVGLPCDLTVLKKRMLRNPQLAQKIQFTIGLFCGHNSQPQLIDNIVDKLSPTPSSKLEHFRFRTGPWRGYSLAKFDQDMIIEKKSSYYNLYQNLYFFCQKKCLHCHDHFAYNSDISVGDIWSFHLKSQNIKHNAVICKNEKGMEIVESVLNHGFIQAEPSTIENILDGQARGAPTHNNTSAKSRASKRFGMKIRDRHNRKVKWHQYLVAWIIFLNYKWSMNEKYSSLIFKIPRRFLKAYLVVFKGLESLK
jgi:coenzyme F420 hydrogenase subunit beta